MDSRWLKQEEEPLFPDVIWAKPERKQAAGRLLVLGGHRHGFDAVGKAYQAAVESGIGEVKVALPDALKPILGPSLPDAVYANSTPTGNLAQSGQETLERYIDWAKATLLVQAGDNSETTLLLGRLLRDYPDHPFALTDEALSSLTSDVPAITQQPNRLWVLSFAGAQKLASAAKSPTAFLASMGLRPFVLALLDVEAQIKQPIAAVYEDAIVIAHNGKASSTKRAITPDIAMLAGTMSVWWLQHPGKQLEALSSAAFEF